MPYYLDQIGREIFLPKVPQRIVSLVPSQTELLFYLELGDRVVGVTKFCVHPMKARKTATIVGGTKTLHLDKIKALKPDLIIGNKEENTKSEIEALQALFPVWMSDIYNLQDNLQMIESLGEILEVRDQAAQLIQQLKADFAEMAKFEGQKVAYFIWRDPWMVAANQTFIHHILEAIGLLNVFADHSRYPEVTLSDVANLQPDYVFLSSEPYPFKEKHIQELKDVLPGARIKLVNGELFSWYGSRLLHLKDYIVGLT